LHAWDNFYLILGPSAAALIGLQFLVMTLISDMNPDMIAIEAISAFGTPTVVHLGGAVVISVILSAPWPSLAAASIPLVICGFIGIAYAALVSYRAGRQTSYEAVVEDWLWFVILPGAAYLTLTIAALLLRSATQRALFVIAGAVLALLLVGVHNTWDTVTYLVLRRAEERRRARPGSATIESSPPSPASTPAHDKKVERSNSS
jgi:hypothetical protein